MGELSISLYIDRPHGSLDLEAIMQYLRDFGFAPTLKGDYFETLNISAKNVGRELARCRILDPLKEGSLNIHPKEEDINRELVALKSNAPAELKEDLSNAAHCFHLKDVRHLRRIKIPWQGHYNGLPTRSDLHHRHR
jgi:hypothetical protein